MCLIARKYGIIATKFLNLGQDRIKSSANRKAVTATLTHS